MPTQFKYVDGLIIYDDSEPNSKRKLGFPGGRVAKNPPADAGDASLLPRLGRSHRPGNGNSL